MTTKTCDTCGEDKPLDDFAKAGRGRRGTCNGCRTPEPAQDQAATHELTMEPGFGFEAWVESNVLHLRQADAEGNFDTIMLSRTEARVLIAHLTEWAQ